MTKNKPNRTHPMFSKTFMPNGAELLDKSPTYKKGAGFTDCIVVLGYSEGTACPFVTWIAHSEDLKDTGSGDYFYTLAEGMASFAERSLHHSLDADKMLNRDY